MKTSIIKWKLSAPLWTSDIMHVFPCVQMGEWDVEEPFCDVTKDLFPQFYTLHIFWKGGPEKIVSGLNVIMKSLNLCFQHLFAGLFQIKFRFKIHISNVQCHQFPIWDVFVLFCFAFVYTRALFWPDAYRSLLITGGGSPSHIHLLRFDCDSAQIQAPTCWWYEDVSC